MSNPSEAAAPHHHASIPQDAIDQLDKTIAEVFTLMLNRTCNPTPRCPSDIGKPLEPLGQTQPEHRPGLTASISFSGSLRGACSVHLPLRTATALTGELIGPMPEDEAVALNADTAGEICNMIAGSWKSRRQDNHSTCALSVPAITTPGLQLPAHDPEPADSPFRNLVTRIYSFEDHCLHLKLAFD